jgi:hypothetical protein
LAMRAVVAERASRKTGPPADTHYYYYYYYY